MDASLYKDFTTSRGFKYHYWYASAKEDKPILLFCHGFPSTSNDWRKVAPYFAAKGYGIIVPDMLGYGGTDKPTDPALYVQSAIGKDLVDILDHERVSKAIAIGHDWGSFTVSRLANFYPERFLAYAFFATAYQPPMPHFDLDALLAHLTKKYGYEIFGYWSFFAEDSAAKIMEEHLDSLVSCIWPSDPMMSKTLIAPTGALKNALLTDFKSPLPPYISEQEKEDWIASFRRGGFEGPTCWYKHVVRQFAAKDDQKIPPERALPPATSPLFFGAASLDCISLPAAGYELFQSEQFKSHDVTMKEYHAGHWLIISRGDEVNRDLEAWIEGVVTKSK